MSKSFTEACGREPFNWNQFLKKALYESISREEYEEACILSSSWVTCAVGNQCAIIPRENSERWPIPIDAKLRRMGGDFHCHIVGREFWLAVECLDEIEKRSAQIINQIRKEATND